MTLHSHARTIVQDELEQLERGRRVNGFPNCAEVQERDLRGIRRRTHQRLKDSGQYGSIELWWFVLTTLASIVMEVIKWRRENVNNMGGA